MKSFSVFLASQLVRTLAFTPNQNNLLTNKPTSLQFSKKGSSYSTNSSPSGPSISSPTSDDEDPLERTKKHLEKISGTSVFDQDEEVLYRQFVMKPANLLKEELAALKLQTKGRKPDLARRLVEYYISNNKNSQNVDTEEDVIEAVVPQWEITEEDPAIKPLRTFADIAVSVPAGTALARAGFTAPTPIQASALPLLSKDRESLILHAETGSGKTLCYLLPITERIWRERDVSTLMNDEAESSYALILTPTRELAAQVAGVANCLAPPGSVRLVTTPTNLVRDNYEAKERSEGELGGRFDNVMGGGGQAGTKIIVGSARSIFLSLFGDSKLHPPTSKPEAKTFLSNVNYLVLDEVDRLLNIKTGRAKTSKYYTKHDKPAGIISSSISKFTLGQFQIVAASATVGRPLRRELARVLGLAPDECPRVVRPSGSIDGSPTRLVTAPLSLTHYVMPCEGSSRGGLLTAAAFLVKGMSRNLEGGKGRRTLFVITKACGISIKDAIGALKHFNVQPQPNNLLDVLEADGTDRLIEAYRTVSGAAGIGQSSTKVAFDPAVGYLLVTGEESVRGIHLDDLNTVVVVGKPKTPDEYIHIAGRAGRAGKKGSVVTILDYEQVSSLSSWEGMLGFSFIPIDESEISTIE